jgi:hypothetical protein
VRCLLAEPVVDGAVVGFANLSWCHGFRLPAPPGDDTRKECRQLARG